MKVIPRFYSTSSEPSAHLTNQQPHDPPKCLLFPSVSIVGTYRHLHLHRTIIIIMAIELNIFRDYYYFLVVTFTSHLIYNNRSGNSRHKDRSADRDRTGQMASHLYGWWPHRPLASDHWPQRKSIGYVSRTYLPTPQRVIVHNGLCLKYYCSSRWEKTWNLNSPVNCAEEAVHCHHSTASINHWNYLL